MTELSRTRHLSISPPLSNGKSLQRGKACTPEARRAVAMRQRRPSKRKRKRPTFPQVPRPAARTIRSLRRRGQRSVVLTRGLCGEGPPTECMASTISGAKRTWAICTRRASKLCKARSRLYRSQILQVKNCWKALAEIYTTHSFAPFYTLNFLFENC